MDQRVDSFCARSGTGNLGGNDNRSNPRSAAPAVPHSPVSPAPNSATSTSRLPFFERYQKLVDTSGSNNEAAAAAGQVGSAIPRSPRLALANLAPPASPQLGRSQTLSAPQGEQASMSTSRSEPLLSPPLPMYPIRKNSLPSPRSPQFPPGQPYSRRETEQAVGDQVRQPAPSKSPSRREFVESTYLAYATFGDDYAEEDHKLPYSQTPAQHEALTPTWSSPADLAGLTVPSSPAPRDRFARDDAAPSGLDACLADLQLLAEGDAVDDGAVGLMIRGFDPDPAEQGALTRKQQGRQPQSTRSPTPRSRPVPPRQESFETRRAESPSAPTCAVCCRPLAAAANDLRRGTDHDGQAFCRPCYADRYLPKCRKCHKPIEGGAVTSSDGKIAGKYHADCFGCFECSAPFPDGEFYVLCAPGSFSSAALCVCPC